MHTFVEKCAPVFKSTRKPDSALNPFYWHHDLSIEKEIFVVIFSNQFSFWLRLQYFHRWGDCSQGLVVLWMCTCCSLLCIYSDTHRRISAAWCSSSWPRWPAVARWQADARRALCWWPLLKVAALWEPLLWRNEECHASRPSKQTNKDHLKKLKWRHRIPIPITDSTQNQSSTGSVL